MAEPLQECFSRFPKIKVSTVSRLRASGSTDPMARSPLHYSYEIVFVVSRAPEGEKVVVIDISSCFFFIIAS